MCESLRLKNYITLDAIEFLKKRYPEKVGSIDFTDFGNLSLFHYLDYKPAASIDEDFHEVGKQAALLLFKMMNEKNYTENEEPKPMKINCELIIHK
jgi:DNA-binding LacI/PurR family transcriptional regulator